MGFDLYGVNPTNPDNLKQPFMDWGKEHTEEEKQEHFKKVDEYEAKVPGNYFRNNVWWWRPLWNFVCAACDDILTQKDVERGSYNDCHEISEEKASSIAKHLQEKIDDGTAAHYENEIKLAFEQAEKDEHGNPTDWDMMYPFTVAHVKEFILFCSESGGFDIG